MSHIARGDPDQTLDRSLSIVSGIRRSDSRSIYRSTMRSPVVIFIVLGLVAASSPSLFSSVQAGWWLDPHNAARRSENAGIPDLAWNSTLAQFAYAWAQHQAKQGSCNLVHSHGPFGENIYWYSASATPTLAVNAWVAEKQYYDYANNSCASGQMCGHYTQVVWKNTQSVGCGSATCDGGSTFMVCSYYPPGNYIGQKPY